MQRKNQICGIILSAGASTRMGRDKALLPWPPVAPGTPDTLRRTLLDAQIDVLMPFADTVIVVAGRNFEQLAPLADAAGAFLVRNPDPDRGQFSSLQAGLQEVIARGHSAAMITLVDAPPLHAASIQKLCTAFESALAAGLWGVVPIFNGKHGHPLFAGRTLIDAFLAAPVASNARVIKHQNSQFIESVPVDDEMLTTDVNTPQQYEALALNAEERNR